MPAEIAASCSAHHFSRRRALRRCAEFSGCASGCGSTFSPLFSSRAARESPKKLHYQLENENRNVVLLSHQRAKSSDESSPLHLSARPRGSLRPPVSARPRRPGPAPSRHSCSVLACALILLICTRRSCHPPLPSHSLRCWSLELDAAHALGARTFTLLRF